MSPFASDREANEFMAAVYRTEAARTRHPDWACALCAWADARMRAAYPDPQLNLFGEPNESTETGNPIR